MRCLPFVLSCVAALVVAGCTSPSDPTYDLMETELSKTKIDDLSRTIDVVFSERQFDQKEFESKVASGLNRWTKYAPAEVTSLEWATDPLAEPLLKEFSELAILKVNAELNFVDLDSYYLQESAWIEEVVDRSTKLTHLNAVELYRLAADDYKPSNDTADPIAEVVRKLHPELDEPASVKLAQAFKYFDWIVRNIQLLPEVDHVGDDLDELKLNDQAGLAAAGIAGTGYQRFPWQTLLYARGDYVDRAKLFMIGLQHLGMDSIMLAVNRESTDQAQPWVVAVPIAGEYYLFDTKLALPIPGANAGSFATLSAVRANPKLITGLDLTVEESLEENSKYWVTPGELESLVGFIYISPESISKRMKCLEKGLVGEQRLPLTMLPSMMKQRLPALEQVELKAWDTAFKTHQFRQAVREAVKDVGNNVLVDRLRWYYDEESYIDAFARYRTARARFFVGRFDIEREITGYNVIESMENLMYTDEVIDGLATDSLLQERLGILRPYGSNEVFNAADFNLQLASVQGQMRLVRRDVGLFLAQCHFDNGSVSAAANWLKLLQEKEDAERWQEGVNYLLGRALESRKEYDLANDQYRKFPKSVQAHGNLVRARLLAEIVEKVFGKVHP